MATNILKMIPGPTHGLRYYAVEFAAQQEIVNGETLSGTPTLSIDVATSITLSSLAGGTVANQGVISGTQVRFWIKALATAVLGNRKITVTVSTSGGAQLNEVCTLRLVEQF